MAAVIAIFATGLLPSPCHPTLSKYPRALALRGGGPALNLAAGVGAAYSMALANHPIMTQSVTSALTFALSDTVAQSISPPPGGRGLKRTVVTAAIGLLYFGPALHYFLMWVTALVPGTDLLSTLQKTLLGQLGFGPAMTCIFFGAFLVADHGISSGLKQWPAKIRQDLLVTWTTELCFWPFVDIVYYSFLPVVWIPLGYNIANFFWTVFLSLQAARGLRKTQS